MKRKWIAGLLVAVLCIMAISGCGTKTDKTEEQTDFASLKGNAKEYDMDTIDIAMDNKLKGKSVVVLGSTAVDGYASEGVGVAEFIETYYEGCKVTKVATSDDATISTKGKDSYVDYLKEQDKDAEYDFIICQIPVEDVTQKVDLGEVSEEDIKSSDANTNTIYGAMEFIINYADETWGCPVVFFTNSRYDNNGYDKLVEGLSTLKSKYPYLGVANLWAKDGKYLVFNGISDEERQLYAYDNVHMTKAGYSQWWGPKLGREIDSYLKKYYAEGNAEEYDMNGLTPMENSPLAGKRICALGSSVTYGESAFQQAVGEYIAVRFDATLTKEAVSGTTLADLDDTSYVSRMKNNLSKDDHFDLFIVQLSTNDATQGIEIGQISNSMNLEDFDTRTILGAMEYIINYVDQTWGCPVAFYTGTQYGSDDYSNMVQQLLQLKLKYPNLIVLDLYSNDAFNDISDEDRALYMSDPIHPTRAGYSRWWGPEMERQLMDFYSN